MPMPFSIVHSKLAATALFAPRIAPPKLAPAKRPKTRLATTRLATALLAVLVLLGPASVPMGRGASVAFAQDCTPQIGLDQPTDGAPAGPATLTGWALDLSAPGGSGVSAVRLYRDGAPESGGSLLADATIGLDRPDIDAFNGVTHSASGWTAAVDLTDVAGGSLDVNVVADTMCGTTAFTQTLAVAPAADAATPPTTARLSTPTVASPPPTSAGFTPGASVSVSPTGSGAAGTPMSSPGASTAGRPALSNGGPDSAGNVSCTVPSGSDFASQLTSIAFQTGGTTATSGVTCQVAGSNPAAPSTSQATSRGPSPFSVGGGGSSGGSSFGGQASGLGSGAVGGSGSGYGGNSYGGPRYGAYGGYSGSGGYGPQGPAGYGQSPYGYQPPSPYGAQNPYGYPYGYPTGYPYPYGYPPAANQQTISVTATATGNAVLTWTPVGTASTYRIYQSTTAVAGSFTLVQTAAQGASTITVTGLTSGITYSFQIRAADAYGGETPIAGTGTPGSASALVAPTGFTVVSTANTTITLTWNVVQNAAGYRVFQSTTGSSYVPAVSSATGQTTVVVSGLTPNTSYYFYVVGIDAAGGQGPAAASIRISTTNAPTSIPAPTGLALLGTTRSTATLTWLPSSGATGYRIYQATPAGAITVARTSVTAATAAVVSDLAPATQYFFAVVALDAAGNQSAPSTIVPATTAP